MLILLTLYMCVGNGLETCMWFGYNPQILFCHFPQFELSLFSGILTINICRQYVLSEGKRLFQALLLLTYADSMYFLRVNPPIDFTFSDDS